MKNHSFQRNQYGKLLRNIFSFRRRFIIVSVTFLISLIVSFLSFPLAFAITWTDKDLLANSVLIAPDHIREIRRAVYNKRALCGLPTLSWDDPTLIPKTTQVRAVHIQQLREAIKEVYEKAPVRPTPSFLEVLVSGQSIIRASHIYELRKGIEDATCCGDGECQPQYEDAVSCPADCGVCVYNDWTTGGCGSGGCEAYEVRRMKKAPGAGCNDLVECVADHSNCCNYELWQDYSCGGGGCDTDAKRQSRTSNVAGCAPEYQCLSAGSCCEYAGWVSSCGYKQFYPSTTLLEVNATPNDVCEPSFRNIQPNDDSCCGYQPVTSTCGGTVNGQVYPESSWITVSTPTNNACEAKLTVDENADECCDFTDPVSMCGGTFTVNGQPQTFPDTTYIEVKYPNNPNCTTKIITELPKEQDNTCCGYQGITGQCGYVPTYPASDWVEVNVPTNSRCDIIFNNHTANADNCCGYTVTSGCGNGTDHPTTSWVTLKTPSNSICPVQTVVEDFTDACCGYGPWTAQCGHLPEYNDTYSVEFRTATNPACPIQFRNVVGPNASQCCQYAILNNVCGGVINGVTYPDTTLIYSQKPGNPNCPWIINTVSPMDDFCCGYQPTQTQCGDGITHSPRDSITSQTPNNPNCPVIVDQVITDGCCGYPLAPTKTCGYGSNPNTTSAMVSTPTNNICETVVTNVTADDPFCCNYGGYNKVCGHGSYPATTEVEVNIPANVSCQTLYQNPVPMADSCCGYGVPQSQCGGTVDSTTYPDTDWVTWKTGTNGQCPADKIVSVEVNHQNCCNYQIQSACGNGTEYPDTYWVTKKIPQNSSCPTQVIGTPRFDEQCCNYGPIVNSCEGTGNTTLVKKKIPGNGNCNVNTIGFPTVNAQECCGYTAYGAPQCGYTPTGVPDTTLLEVSEPATNPSCSVHTRNIIPFDQTCCQYGGYLQQCGYGSTYPPSTSVEVNTPQKSACPALTRNPLPFDEGCCGYAGGVIEDRGCGASYQGVSCGFDSKLKVTHPTDSSCSLKIACSVDPVCTSCQAGDTPLPCPDQNSCPYQRVCEKGTWGSCKQANPVCNPGVDEACPADSNGFITYKTCNTCGTAWGSCFCNAEDTQTCITSDNCPGIVSCSSGAWAQCQQSNSVCTPGNGASCLLPGNLPGEKICNSCGDNYGPCVCIPGSIPCNIEGSQGKRTCNVSTGQYDSCQCLPGPMECTPGDSQLCLLPLFSNKTCNVCGKWGVCQ